MSKPIFVLIPGVKGDHCIRVDTIVNIIRESDESLIRKSIISIERNNEVIDLYSSASVKVIHSIIQSELSFLKNQ